MRKRGAKVVDVGVDGVEHCVLVGPAGRATERHRPITPIGGVAVLYLGGVGLFGEAIGGELTQCFQQPIPHARCGRDSEHHRLVHEMPEGVEHLETFDNPAGGDRLRGVEIEAAGQCRQTLKHDPLDVAQ